MRVGIVEDDDGVARALAEALRLQRIESVRFERGAQLLTGHDSLDVVILDLGLPDIDGMTVLRRLRKISAVPVIVLTARDDERSTVLALRHGADDYLTKPARVFELMARLETVTRRAANARGLNPPEPQIPFGEFLLDLDGRNLVHRGEEIMLTAKEFEVLLVLVESRGAAVSREKLLDQIWGDAYQAVSRTLDVHINALRGKLAPHDMIETIRGFGYRLVVS